MTGFARADAEPMRVRGKADTSFSSFLSWRAIIDDVLIDLSTYKASFALSRLLDKKLPEEHDVISFFLPSYLTSCPWYCSGSCSGILVLLLRKRSGNVEGNVLLTLISLGRCWSFTEWFYS